MNVFPHFLFWMIHIRQKCQMCKKMGKHARTFANKRFYVKRIKRGIFSLHSNCHTSCTQNIMHEKWFWHKNYGEKLCHWNYFSNHPWLRIYQQISITNLALFDWNWLFDPKWSRPTVIPIGRYCPTNTIQANPYKRGSGYPVDPFI